MTGLRRERGSWPPDKDDRGLECRKCGCRHFFVDHTRRANGMIVRYRRCRHCGQRMTTCERAVG
ncbi:MAG: hypothetical protein AB1601_10920 [Planctomycetota bacterium]